jgi:uncharacterized protein (DUF2147 family)
MSRRLPKSSTVMIAGMAAAALLVSGAPAHPQNATGLWLTRDRDAKVRVGDCGGSLCGTIAWLAQPIDKATGKPVTDNLNPDPARRSRPLIGVRIFSMQPAGPKRWTGPIYNADDGRTYNGSLEVLDTNRLKIEGCLAPLLCDHEIWTRTN